MGEQKKNALMVLLLTLSLVTDKELRIGSVVYLALITSWSDNSIQQFHCFIVLISRGGYRDVKIVGAIVVTGCFYSSADDLTVGYL